MTNRREARKQILLPFVRHESWERNHPAARGGVPSPSRRTEADQISRTVVRGWWPVEGTARARAPAGVASAIGRGATTTGTSQVVIAAASSEGTWDPRWSLRKTFPTPRGVSVHGPQSSPHGQDRTSEDSSRVPSSTLAPAIAGAASSRATRPSEPTHSTAMPCGRLSEKARAATTARRGRRDPRRVTGKEPRSRAFHLSTRRVVGSPAPRAASAAVPRSPGACEAWSPGSGNDPTGRWRGPGRRRSSNRCP